MSLERNERKYGDHTLIGDNNDTFFDQSWLGKAQDLGWSDGCPVVTRLVKSPEEGGRGEEVMAKRYGPVNYWGGTIKEAFVKAGRQDLFDQFTLQRPRHEDEPRGTHDADWAPSELNDQLLITPEAYSLPRIMIAYITDPKQGQSVSENQDRFVNALDALEEATQTAGNIKEVMVSVTESLVKHGGDTVTLLKNALPQGKIGEDNVQGEYRETLEIMEEQAPELHEIYTQLSPEEKQKVGMAQI
jgi:hypothetical protein